MNNLIKNTILKVLIFNGPYLFIQTKITMRKIVCLSATLLLTTGAIFAQSNKVIEGKPGMHPSFVAFEPNSAPAFVKGKIPLTDEMARIVKNTPGNIIGQEQDAIGQVHYRYQQTINDIPVELGIYNVHTKGQKVVAENGVWINNIPTHLPKVTLSESNALSYALQFVNALSYKWQDANEEAFLKSEQKNANATFYPKGQLVYYSGEEDVIPSELRPAYKFDIYASNPISRQIIFVDAANGQILGKRELLHTTNATGTATTAYSGTQTITTDNTGTTYRLRETGRGNGIQTYNMQKGTSYNAAVDFTDADNAWNNVNTNKDQYATDAHWGAEKTYDYYFAKYGRNSINNAGFAILSYVHYSTSYFNAFWDGSRMTYGDGNATDGNKPLTALDVCGHEISHGLTSFTSNLTYSGESGAMNEGFSDIFGTAIEFYARPSNADWLIGGDFYTIRSMSNPNAYSQPDTYQGTYWYTGSSDNGGVHTNSGVLNFWFYLLSQGGSGTNDKGFAYNVTGLGIDKAAAIAYRTNTVYLVSSSKYANARTASLQAAADLYGAGSAEVTQTGNAWDAVGVGTTVTPPNCTDAFENNNTRATSKSLPLNVANTALISSSSDKDWFTFTTTAAAPKLKLSLTNLPADYDVKLYNSSGSTLATSQNGSTTAESIVRNATAAATYYVQVYGYGGVSSTSCYTLQVSTSGTNFFGDGQGLMASTKPAFEEGGSFGVYPNPAKDKLTLYVNAEESSYGQITMTDALGRAVVRQTAQIQKGMNTISLNVASLAPGMYIAKINGYTSVKVQVIK